MKKVTIAMLALVSQLAFAVPTDIDVISATLLGDIRDDNPDLIAVDVDGKQVVGSESFFFSVDFADSMDTNHPTARLQQLVFNLNPEEAQFWDVELINASVGAWDVEGDTKNPGAGTGNLTFTLGIFDEPGVDVIPLEFLLTRVDKDGNTQQIFGENFWDAAFASSDVGDFQVSAKVGGLTLNDIATSDSGTAVGCWAGGANCGGGGSGGGGGTGTPVNAPGTMALLGIGIVGLLAARRQNQNKSK